MIIDVEKAFIDYFTDRMSLIVGNGNGEVGLYRNRFPDDSNKEGICFFAELKESWKDVYDFEDCGIRVICRTTNKEHTFWVTQNIDDVLDGVFDLNLNDDVQLRMSHRNAGPDFFEGDNDNFDYGTALYSITVRNRIND